MRATTGRVGGGELQLCCSCVALVCSCSLPPPAHPPAFNLNLNLPKMLPSATRFSSRCRTERLSQGRPFSIQPAAFFIQLLFHIRMRRAPSLPLSISENRFRWPCFDSAAAKAGVHHVGSSTARIKSGERESGKECRERKEWRDRGEFGSAGLRSNPACAAARPAMQPSPAERRRRKSWHATTHSAQR